MQDYTFVLATRAKEILGVLKNVAIEEFTFKNNLNSANEASFVCYKMMDGEEDPLFDRLQSLLLIYIPELKQYYEADVSLEDEINPRKTVTCTGLCEAELSQINLYDYQINTEEDILRDDYEVTVFYNPENPKASLLNRILEKAPHYTIGHVDDSLKNLQRTFAVDGTTIYDFMTSDCSEQFHCLFQFDSMERTINAYDLYSVCEDCGYRGDFDGECPNCGSTRIKYFGKDTTVFVDVENLTNNIQFTTDKDSIKNTFKVEAGDDLMTATVVALNPNGTDYIYYFDSSVMSEMPTALVEKINDYNELYDSYVEEYRALMADIYQLNDDILYLTSGMMPTPQQDEKTAASEAAKLNVANLSPTGINIVSATTSISTINSALKNYAAVYVDTGHFKVEVVDGATFILVGQEDSYNYGTWTGSFRVTNWSDAEDVATTPVMNITITEKYDEFIKDKILQVISTNDEDDGSVFDVLRIDDIDEFEAALTLYCLNRLISFRDATQAVLDLLVEVDQADPAADLYEEFYVPYKEKLDAIDVEISARQRDINTLQTQYDADIARQAEIQEDLNFRDYLGDELYAIFSSYRREDKYSNSNYTSEGLDNEELFEKAQEFLDAAEREIKIAGTPQHSISTTLDNLLLIPEFEPLRDDFELGNWIRIRVDDQVYRLRLISYGISSSSEEQIEVEFSDLTVSSGTVSDMQSLLAQATSMSSTYAYVSQQSSAAKDEMARLLAQEKTERQLMYDRFQAQLNSSNGMYSTVVRQEGGGSIYYFHDMPILEESTLVWMFSEKTFAMSTDGGVTYPYGITVDGDATLGNILAEGLNANWIKTGALTVTDGQDPPNVIFKADIENHEVIIGSGVIPDLDIGGTNLLANGMPEFTTENEVNYVGYHYSVSSPITWSIGDNAPYISVNVPAGTTLPSDNFIIQIQRRYYYNGVLESALNEVAYEEGKEYVASFEAIANTPVSIGLNVYAQPTSSSSSRVSAASYADNAQTIAQTTTWQRYHWAFTIPEGWSQAAAAKYRIMPYLLNIEAIPGETDLSSDVELFIRHLKIEQGDCPTDWSRAMADYDYDTGNIQTALQNQISGVADDLATTTDKLAAETSQLIVRQGEIESAVTRYTTDTSGAIKTLSSTVTNNAESVRLSFLEQNGKLDPLVAWITFDADEQNNPRMTLGAEQNAFKTKLTNEKLGFYQKDDELAYMSNKTLYITQAHLLDRLRIGNFGFTPRSNGNLSFGLVGD